MKVEPDGSAAVALYSKTPTGTARDYRQGSIGVDEGYAILSVGVDDCSGTASGTLALGGVGLKGVMRCGQFTVSREQRQGSYAVLRTSADQATLKLHRGVPGPSQGPMRSFIVESTWMDQVGLHISKNSGVPPVEFIAK